MPTLPLELCQDIARLSDRGSLARLTRVSHAFYKVACPILWENVPDAQILLDLLDCSVLLCPTLATSNAVVPFESVSGTFLEI